MHWRGSEHSAAFGVSHMVCLITCNRRFKGLINKLWFSVGAVLLGGFVVKVDVGDGSHAAAVHQLVPVDICDHEACVGLALSDFSAASVF